ncbi:hypothetical protein Tco_0890282 [Tanacetum coccineum]|uniref:Uncharacterized protein n=1 Tax=Tanacetum coccineum TaxID=301880 RepID=A0ABQ5C016_9ASTR
MHPLVLNPDPKAPFYGGCTASVVVASRMWWLRGGGDEVVEAVGWRGCVVDEVRLWWSKAAEVIRSGSGVDGEAKVGRQW